jgi:hypothetical protein
MTTPTVTEVPPQLEPVSPDPFVLDLEESVRQDGGAPRRAGDTTRQTLRLED